MKTLNEKRGIVVPFEEFERRRNEREIEREEKMLELEQEREKQETFRLKAERRRRLAQKKQRIAEKKYKRKVVPKTVISQKRMIKILLRTPTVDEIVAGLEVSEFRDDNEAVKRYQQILKDTGISVVGFLRNLPQYFLESEGGAFAEVEIFKPLQDVSVQLLFELGKALDVSVDKKQKDNRYTLRFVKRYPLSTFFGAQNMR